MIWFQHSTTASSDIKIKRLRKKYGMEGVGIWWTTLEIVAREGVGGYLDLKKYPLETMAEEWAMTIGSLKGIVEHMADLALISKDCLDRGIIFVESLPERADEYTKKVERLKEVETTESIQILSGHGKGVKKKQQDTINTTIIKPKEPNNSTLLVKYFLDKYIDVTGVPYPVSWGRDGQLMKEVYTLYGIDKGKALIDEFFRMAATGEGWHSDKPQSIPIMRSVLPELIKNLRKKV